MSVFIATLSYLSYPSASERAIKLALGIILVYSVFMPVFGFVANFDKSNVSDYFEGIYSDGDVDGEHIYAETAEEAFKQGIAKLVCNKYYIEEENIKVVLVSFDFESMHAEKIKIILSGKDSFADWRRIEEYVTGCGLGDCEVNLNFG
jgi:hypothetical protein